MNRSSGGAVKHNPQQTATSGNASGHRREGYGRDDYEAIEAAVMQTPRGRWFLAEYLRRHQNDEARRLLASLRKLLQAQINAQELTGRGAEPFCPSLARQRAAALEGMRLLLAHTADNLAEALHGRPPAEPTLPEAAASRLSLLLHEAHDAPQVAQAALAVLEALFEQLAHMLGEPRPEAIVPPDAPDIELTPAGPVAEAAAGITSSAQATPGSTGPRAMPEAPAPAASASQPQSRSESPPECGPQPSSRPRPGPAEPAWSASRQSGDAAHPRIIIRRLKEPSPLGIPLPDAANTENARPEDGQGKATANAFAPENGTSGGTRRRIIHVKPPR